MTQAVAVRREGDAFQARIFWRKAASLLDPESPVNRIGFETGPKGFDDIWVEYDPPLLDQEGKPLRREHLQCKWHVTPNSYGYAELTDPAFINANARSLLQRALDAQRIHAPDGEGVRFGLVTNWRVGLNDPLRPIIHQRSHALRLDRLFTAGGDRSASGRIRKLWRDHLQLNDAELRLLARTLAVSEATDSLDALREILDPQFRITGLRRFPLTESTFPYDDIPFQWLTQGRLEHDRESLIAACETENLLVGPGEEGRKVYGIKSFEHPIDRLDERCTSVLNFVPQFMERQIRPDSDWRDVLYPALRTFLLDAARSSERLRLVLDAHLTLSFAAGSVLDIKSGKVIELEQRTVGKTVWTADDTPAQADWPKWAFETEMLNGSGNDVVVAIGLTHNITDAVRSYVANMDLPASQLLIAKPDSGASARSVICGRHAFDLAERLTAEIRATLGQTRSQGCVHLFLAGPGGFSFFLGQRHVAIGPLALYEFDFEGANGGSYERSLVLPIC
jgi:hypothetical protein